MKVSIEALDDPMLPNTYNLAFGPVDGEGNIDDMARVFHSNPDKVFSTILLFCLYFLQKNASFQIGLDGSDDTRAYLYHRMFITNKEYLDEYFKAIGVDWYLRLLRNGDFETDSDGQFFFQPKPEDFNYQRPLKDLYRYYVFQLRQNKTKQTKNLKFIIWTRSYNRNLMKSRRCPRPRVLEDLQGLQMSASLITTCQGLSALKKKRIGLWNK